MGSSFVWLLGAAFVASSTILFMTQRGKRNMVLDRLRISRRRVSGAKTPPRSLSPSKKHAQQVQEVNYVDTLPPSRRFTLAKTGVTLESAEATGKLVVSQPNWKQKIIPLETSYIEADDSLYTPSEFMIREVKALGDFPDYAMLSGIPLPKPYLNFDINKAIPRPYRPFRWAYHQTMCTLS
jgi:hypothetical protein